MKQVNQENNEYVLDNDTLEKYIAMHPIRTEEAFKSMLDVAFGNNFFTYKDVEEIIKNEYNINKNFSTILQEAENLYTRKNGITTLDINSTRPLTSEENSFKNELSYIFISMNKMEDISFLMCLDKDTFLIANKDSKRMLFSSHPYANQTIVFVYQKEKILYSVDISIFNNAIKECSFYKVGNHGLFDEVKQAIDKYKKDKLDFYTNSKIIQKSLEENR